MAYCTYSDVAAEFKSLSFSGTTTITDARVTEWIAQNDAYINGRLSKRYSTPITGSEALALVKMISIKLTAGRVQKIIKVKTGEESARQDGQSGDLATEAMEILKQIVDDEIRLTDADLATTHQGIQSNNVNEETEPTFVMGEDNW